MTTPAYVAGSFTAPRCCSPSNRRHGADAPDQLPSIDLREALAALIQQPVAASQLDPGALPAAFHAPGGVKQAADGLVYVQAVEPAHWARLLDEAGGVEDAALSDPPLMSSSSPNARS